MTGGAEIVALKPVPDYREPPFNNDIEDALLGATLIDPVALRQAADRLPAQAFHDPLHERMWAMMLLMLGQDRPVTPLTVAAALGGDSGLAQVGGSAYLGSLARAAPALPNIDDFARILSDLAARRALITAGEDLISAAYAAPQSPGATAETIAAEHDKHIRAIVEGRKASDDPVSWYSAGALVIDRLDQPKEDRKALVPFGIAGLDDEIGGMAPGDLVICGARPGMGKSAVAVAIGHHAARGGHGVFMASLEMKADQLVERGLSMRAYERGVKVPFKLIRLDRVNDQGKDALVAAAAEDANLPFVIDQRRGLTVAQIGMRARRVQMQMRRDGTPLGLVVVDHLHLVVGDRDYRGNRVSEITEISRALKELAGSLNVPIIALAQLNRGPENRDDKRPGLGDLRESGSIEQDADLVLLLHRAEYYLRKAKPESGAGLNALAEWDAKMQRAAGLIDIHAAKVRHGEEVTITARCEIAYNWIGGRVI